MKIVLLTRDTDSAAILKHALETVGTVEAVIMEDPVPPTVILKRRAKRLGWMNVIGQALFQALVVPVLRKYGAKRIREIKQANGMDEAPIAPALIERVPSINDSKTIARLRELQPDVVVIQGTRILSADVLASVTAPFLNIHAGINPLYRGGHGAYWALVDDRPDACGVTVHEVDRGIDTGRILAQAFIRPMASDSFVTYPWLQLAAGIPALLEVLRTPSESWRAVTPPSGPSKLWYHPTLWGYLWTRWRRGIK